VISLGEHLARHRRQIEPVPGTHIELRSISQIGSTAPPPTPGGIVIELERAR
jgi:hypothetical protein